MNTHATNRRLRTRTRTQGGFSLLEVVGAVVLFIGAVALISTAVTAVVSGQRELRTNASLDAVLGDMVASVASAGFEAVQGGSALTPLPCEGSSPVVVRGAESCVTAAGSGFRAVWDVIERGGDGSGSVAAIEVALGAYGPGGEVRTQRAILTPDAPLSGSERLVRVHLQGDLEGLSHVYLVRSAATADVVGSAAVTGEGTALVTVAATACTETDPCRVALTPSTTGWGYDDTHALDAAAVFGAKGVVGLPAGYAASGDVSASVYRRGDAHIQVEAYQESSGRRGWWVGDLAEPNSVCLWARFSDSLGAQEIPFCNGVGDGRFIALGSYQPDPVNFPGIAHPLPVQVPISIHSDAAASTCPVVPGQRYAAPSGWVTVDSDGVCASWTWGRPGEWIAAGESPVAFSTPEIVLSGGTRTVAVVVYTGADARPASGYDAATTSGLFAHPRNASSCPGWSTTGCAPAWLTNPAASAPETTACPGAHCNSSGTASPHVITLTTQTGANRSWPFYTDFSSSTDVNFATSFRGPNPSTITWEVVTSPTAQTFRTCNSSSYTTCSNASVGSSGTGSVAYWSYRGTANTPTSFTIKLTDTTTGKTRNETIRLTGVLDHTDTVSFGTALDQSESTVAWARSITSTGAPQSGSGAVPLSGVTGGISASNPDGFENGWADIVVTAPAAAAGTRSFTVGRIDIPGLTSSSTQVVVRAVAGTVTTTVTADPTQATAGSVTVTVADRAGDPYTGRASFTATLDGGNAGSVRFTPAVCTLNISGSCTVSVSAARAVAGSYNAVVRSGSAQDGDDLSVTSVPRSLTAQPLEIREGTEASGELVVEVRDGAGEALSGVSVSATGSGVTFSSAVSGSGGLARLPVNLTGAAPGRPEITLTAGGLSVGSDALRVTSAPDLIGDPGVVLLNRGVPGSFTATVSGDGAGLSGVAVTASSTTSGVRVTSRTTSDASGAVTFWVVAQSGSPSSFEVLLSAGSLTRTVTVGVS
jgi:hypothetical protein